MLFELDTRVEDGWTVIAVDGDLDVATAPRLRQEAVGVLSAGTRLAIDLSKCTFMDSTGLGVIVGVLKRVRGLDGDLVIVGAPSQVEKVFEITRVSSIVALAETLADADEAAGARAPEGRE